MQADEFEIFTQTRTWNTCISMILNGQHSVNCFCYVPTGMHFKINSVPDPLQEASCLDIFVDKSTWVSSDSFPAMFWAVTYCERQLPIFIDPYCVICKNYRIYSCISRFVYKAIPVFQAKNNDIFESLCTCISRPPWLIIQNKTK